MVGCVTQSSAGGECGVEEYFTNTLSTGAYSVNYVRVRDAFSTEWIIVRDDKPYFGYFLVQDLIHSGGTLRYLVWPNEVSS